MAIDKIRLVSERPCGYQETLANFWQQQDAVNEMELRVESFCALLEQHGRTYRIIGKNYDDYRRIENPESGAVLAEFKLIYEEMS